MADLLERLRATLTDRYRVERDVGWGRGGRPCPSRLLARIAGYSPR